MAGGVRKERAQEVVLGIKAENGTSPEGNGRTGAPEGEGSGRGVPFSCLNAKCHPAVPWGEVRASGCWEPGGGEGS